MNELKIKLLKKQVQAYKLLIESEEITELGYGGAAGGGKTRLGCYLALIIAYQYPTSRGGIARRELKNLKRTTLATFFEVCAELKINDYVYNKQDSVITFSNGSEIILFDTAYQPIDPLYTRFGSYELTYCWIDESNESPFEAIDILFTRVGRKNLIDGVKIKSWTLETFNPNKGHVYRRFYKPFKDNTLPEYRAFIPALAGDNPFLTEDYINKLKRANKTTRERLLYGNFDYDDDPSKLVKYENILNCFTNSFVEKGQMFISADIALQGADRLVVGIWSGLRLIKIVVKAKSTAQEAEKLIKDLAEEYKVPRSNIVFDSDGVGAYLSSYLSNSKAFINNGKPLNDENYKNLKSQCYYKLAEIINNNEMFISDNTEHKELIIEELDSIKSFKADSDSKLQVEPKEKQKITLGRSPDFADMIMMRMFFLIKKNEDFENQSYL